MNALVIERYSPATYVLIDGLNEAARCRVRHKESLEDGLREMEQVYFDVILVKIEENAIVGSAVVERIRAWATELVVPRPSVILMFEGSLPLHDAAKCKSMNASYLRRNIPQVIYDEARVVCWRSRTTKYDRAITVEFRNGHHFFYLGSSLMPVEMAAQLAKLAAILVSGNESYSVEYLADELGICRQSVKKYCFELRRVFTSAQQLNGEEGRTKEIVWMEKRPGGTICGVRSNVIWI
jgi:hypothetical protein